jgi:di/tricarboxylate transporter
MSTSYYSAMRLKVILTLLSCTGALALLCVPPTFLLPSESRVAALALMTIVLWATGIIPEHLTSLLFFLVAMLFSISPANVIFGGFTSAAVWLIFGGFVIGIAIMSTGLGKRVADWTATLLHGSYLKIITGLVTAGVLFSFLMPSSMGRVVLLTPIALSIATHFGFTMGTKGRTGIVLAVILGTYIPAFGVLTANVPNMVLIGMAETQYSLSLLYGPYLLLHFPVLTLIKAILIIGLIVWLYPDTPAEIKGKDNQNLLPWTKQEIILAIVLVLLLILWMTDFIHHISPAWIALTGAVFLLFPGIDIVATKQFNQKINWASIFFIAGILGLGGMISDSGLGNILAGKIISLLPLGKDQNFINYASISFAAAITGIATTLPGVPAVFTPLSESIAQTTDLPITTVLMMQVIGFSTTIFPYQAPPIVIGMQLSGEKFSSAAKICAIMALITALFLVPLDFFWWKILGWL